MEELIGPVEGQVCYAVLHKSDTACVDCPLEQTAQEEAVQQERKIGPLGRTYEIIHSPLPQSNGLIRKLGVCRDITERLESAEKLHRANRELDSFVTTVSHDLRSPLTPLIGFSEFLLERYAESLDKMGLECLGEIEKAGRKMLFLLEDLLTLARVGQLEKPLNPVPTTRIVQDVIQELAVEIKTTEAKVEYGELPDVYVPETLLMDLFRNLLANALRYAEDAPRIEIEGQREQGCNRLLVIDHGPGIPCAEREDVFEPFKRGAGSRKPTGTGIGLATVRKIVRLYDGQVRIEETPGGGATFVVEFFDQRKEA